MKALICILIVCLNAPAWAANISITPTRIILHPQQNTASLTFTNRGEKPLTLQIFVKSWTQDPNGASITEDNRELVVFPKMLRLEGGQARPIRLGFQQTWPEIERSFRIFADELPTVDVETGVVGVIFPVRLSIPVFVRSQAENLEAEMDLIAANIKAGQLRVQIQNQGKQHFALNAIEAQLLDKNGHTLAVLKTQGGRVLAEHSVFFSLPIEAAICAQVYAAEIQATHQKVSKNRRFELSTAHHCSAT